MTDTTNDVYPVGLLADLKLRRIKRGIRLVGSWAKGGNWRAVRNYFRNGWITEHSEPCHHNAGWGWTQKSSARRAEKECKK